MFFVWILSTARRMSLMAQTVTALSPESSALCNKRLMPKSNLSGHASLCLLSFLLPEVSVGCHLSQKQSCTGKQIANSVKGILSDTEVLELIITGKVTLNILPNNPRHHFIRPSWFTVFINPREFPCLKSQLILFTCLSGPQGALFDAEKSSSCK